MQKPLIIILVDVNTTSGTVRGHSISVLDQTINEFLAIPYAEPPVGGLRFDKPKAMEKPLKHIINATVPGYSCMQPNFKFWPDQIDLVPNEDCLVLNIWAPGKLDTPAILIKPHKPVMVWFYGGAFTIGSIFQLPQYNGSVLATHDVVIVAVNYRVNAFGFIYTTDPSASGNVGFYDQLLALKWVKENIAKFGGDSNQVTIFGESAGSWSVSLHILSPLSKGLFHRAILESASALGDKKRPIVTKMDALSVTRDLAKYFNCGDDSKQWVYCLRRVDAKEILKFQSYSTKIAYFWNAIYETDIFPYTAQVAFDKQQFNKDIDIIVGATELEGSSLAYYVFPILQTDNVTKDVFVDLVKQTKLTFQSINVSNIIEYYLSGVDINNSSAVRHKFFEYYGDVLITCPVYLFGETFASKAPIDKNVYIYQWNYGSSDGAIDEIMGVTHGADLRYVFGRPLVEKNKNFTKTDIEFSRYAMKVWTDFAKYGKPESRDKWAPIDVNKGIIGIKEMNPITGSHMLKKNPFAVSCDQFWRNYYL